uniref:Cytochrome P450 n=2 Tax=Caenorhabditis japonica TaxID=281687 RepID=A0A8R1DPG8_CAEJA
MDPNPVQFHVAILPGRAKAEYFEGGAILMERTVLEDPNISRTPLTEIYHKFLRPNSKLFGNTFSDDNKGSGVAKCNLQLRNGPEWYRLRSSIQHAMMRPQSVQTYLPFSQKVSQDLVSHVASEQARFGAVNMQKVAGRWSLESAGQILFEKSLGSLAENSEWADGLIELNKRIFQLSAKMRLGLPIFRFFPTPSWRKMVQLEDEFYAEVDRLMDDALDKLKVLDIVENKNLRFASYLINRKELNRRDVKVILLSMFTDGLSTTAPMLIYNLFNIATHPVAQERIRKELEKDATKLPFLRACIKETFRMFPIGTEVSRITQKDLVLSGFEIPAGTPVDINTNVLMRNTVLFADDPLIFKPERWLDKSTATHHPFAFLPFGFGPRMCAGRRFAEQDLLTSLAKLCAKFEIRHVGEPVTQIYETLLLPRGSCKFEFASV